MKTKLLSKQHGWLLSLNYCLLILVSIFVVGCQDTLIEPVPATYLNQSPTIKTITISDAKTWFKEEKNKKEKENNIVEYSVYSDNVVLEWKNAIVENFFDSLHAIVVPVKNGDSDLLIEKTNYSAVFFIDFSNQIRLYIREVNNSNSVDRISKENAIMLAQVSDGIPLFDICAWESFPFKSTGFGYTVQLNFTRIGMDKLGDFKGGLEYKIPVLCIQVGSSDAYGNSITAQQAAELTKIAFNEARTEVFTDWCLGLIRLPAQARSAFIGDFRNSLLANFSSASVSTMACLGDIPESTIKYIPPLCIPTIY